MPRSARIRWTKGQVSRLKTAVRSFNAARAWAEKKVSGISPYLPEKASYTELRKTIQTSRELNNIVRSLQRGSTWKAFDVTELKSGALISKWRKREAEIAFAVQERAKAVARRKAGIQIGDVIKTGHMRTLTEYNLLPAQKKVAEMNADQISRLLERFRSQMRSTPADRALRYYENYKRAIDESGMSSSFPTAMGEVLRIVEEIGNKDPDRLVRIFGRDDEEARIEFVYEDLMYMSIRAWSVRDYWRKEYDAWLADNAS